MINLPDDPLLAAPRLLGSTLTRKTANGIIRVKIVETESYAQNDPASHSYAGQTQRNIVMFGSSGILYVYFTYGMHFCMNVVTGKAGNGQAVLIRAAEPLDGLEIIRKNRPGIITDVCLTNGPAKLTQALAIDMSFNGHDLRQEQVTLDMHEPLDRNLITVSKRIGIKKNADLPARFFINSNPFVSRP